MAQKTNAATGGFITPTTLLMPGSIDDFVDLHRRVPLVIDEIGQASSHLIWSLQMKLEELGERSRTGDRDALSLFRGHVHTAELMSALIRDRVVAWTTGTNSRS